MLTQKQVQPQPDNIIIRLHDPATLADLERDAALVRLMLLADPAYAAWSEQRRIENELAYDAWLTSPEGEAWIDSMAEGDLEARCLTSWEGW